MNIIYLIIASIVLLSIFAPKLTSAFFNFIIELLSFLTKIFFSKFMFILFSLCIAGYFLYGNNININKIKHYIIPPDTSLSDLYKERWSMPLKNTHINSKYGTRHSKWHNGIDLKLKKGEPVLSVFDGYVKAIGFDKQGYGNYVLIEHNNGFETLYGHLIKANVYKGEYINAGSIIGFGGSTGHSTGAHLHFEIKFDNSSINPERIFDFEHERLY